MSDRATADLAPVVLFVYNRPEHTRKTVTALQLNQHAAESDLIIYSDAAKAVADQPAVDAVRAYAAAVTGFRSVTVISRRQNYGLSRSIIEGVTEVINRYGRVIVLEDDLVTSPFFLTYMNQALDHYVADSRVWHISGYTPPLDVEPGQHFFIRPTTCWGWATWGDRWQFFRKDSTYFLSLFTPGMIRDFNLNGTYDYYSHLVLNHKGKLNTWAIFWYLTVYEHGGLSLHPRKSLVRNIGQDSSGQHCVNVRDELLQLESECHGDFPVPALASEDLMNSLERFNVSSRPSMFRRVQSRWLKLLRSLER